jgi:signal transduction histidine kinase/CheY-like chemotaxis protein
MWKKQPNQRLDILFSNLNQADSSLHPESLLSPGGWTWECNARRNFISCSPEVEAILGISSEEFLNQSLDSFALVSKSKSSVEKTLNQDSFPAEVDVYYQSIQGLLVATRITIFLKMEEDGNHQGWRGFTQVISSNQILPEPIQTSFDTPGQDTDQFLTGQIQSSNEPLIAKSIKELPDHILLPPRETSPTALWDITVTSSDSAASISKKVHTQGNASGLTENDTNCSNDDLVVNFDMEGSTGTIEIAKNDSQDKWDEDDQLLVQEVATQLSLALENARLYNSAQQQLDERIKAEQETLQRNRDLSSLNQIGQKLNRLATPAEILETISTSISQVIDTSDLFIAIYDEEQLHISFPVYVIDSQPQILTGRTFGNGFVEYVINSRTPLLIKQKIKEELKSKGVESFGQLPKSLLAVPMLADNKVIGVIVVQDFDHEGAFTEIQAELLSTIASQATIALENATLFQQMQGALVTIEVRERYQKNVARAVAALSELGTQSLADVLHILGEATQTSRVYFAQLIDATPNTYWQIISEWRDPEKPSWITNTRIFMKIPTNMYPFLANELREQGKISGLTSIMPSPERDFLQSLNVLAFLAIAVPGKNKLPSFIGFDELDYERPWGTEEIETLQMAASALSNTMIREDLLDQLQTSLDETENLYNASRRLALANNLQEMIASVTEGLRISSVNRGEIILFKYGTYGNIESLQVVANWQSWGAPPPPVGTNYHIQYLEDFKELTSPTPSFIPDIHSDFICNQFQTEIIDPDHTFSLAILPMWLGKRQMGVLLLHSETKHHFTDAEVRAYPSLIGQMAIAVENLRLFEQTQQTLGETELLYQASAELNIAKNYKDILDALLKYPFLEKWSGLTDETMYVSFNYFENPPLGNDYPDRVQIAAQNKQLLLSYINPQFFLRKFKPLPQLLRSGTPVLIQDLATYAGIDEETRFLLAKRLNIKCAMFMPLFVGGQWIGFIVALYQKNVIFKETEIRQFSVLTGQAAVAFQNLRNVTLAEKHAEEALLLFQTSQHLTQAQTEAEFYQVTLDTCQKGVKPQSLAIYFLDQNNDADRSQTDTCYKMAARWSDNETSLFTEDIPVPVNRLPYSNLLHAGESVITNNASVDTRLSEEAKQWLRKADITSAIFVPILVRGQIIGVLIAGRKEARSFTQSEMTFIQSIVSQLAVTLDNYHLLQEAQKRALELQTAAEIARDTSSTLALDTLLSRLVNLLLDRFSFYHAAIFLVDEQNEFAVIREATGEAGAEMKNAEYRILIDLNSIIGTVARSAQPLLVNNVNSNSLFIPNSLLPATQSELAIPLKISEQVIGVLDVQSSVLNAFTADDVIILQTLTDQIAVAINNASSFEIAQKAIVEMREVDRLKSQFLANMSHELRTPLNSIIGFSRVIMKGIDGPITETQQVDLNAIYSSGQHLLGLITDILDVSKIEAGKMQLTLEDVNLADLINSVMSTAAGLVKDKPIKLIRKVAPGLPMIKADPMRLRQVLINFLSNAAKFTDEGFISVEAYIQKVQNSDQKEPWQKSELIVTVTDSGPGIAEADQKKLFQPFSQVDDSPTRKTGGTGLGLSISRSLIELHGGRIGLMQSEVGKGSTFFFSIPLKQTGKLSLPEVNPAQENGNNVILAIDDDVQVISLYERYLTPHGFKVISQTESATAIDQAKKIKPFAITLDIMMPNEDGWQVLHALKNDPQTRDIPVIMCSILQEEEKGFSLGASDFLVKPILQEDLINALTRLDFNKQGNEVLVVDDDPADLKLINKMLETNQTFQIKLAQDGPQAWSMIHDHHPNAIILDLFVHGMDGFSLMEKIHDDPILRDLPVIVLTGEILTPEQHQQLTDFGQQFLNKSLIDEKDLLNYLELALNRLKPQTVSQPN